MEGCGVVLHFADTCLAACEAKNSRLVIGLDPHPALLPPHLVEKFLAKHPEDRRQAMAATITEFNASIIEAVADYAVAVKPQLAFYEQWGPSGLAAYEASVQAAQKAGLLVIADGKRNDIGSSAEGYAAAYLGPAPSDDGVQKGGCSTVEADAITINPYLGSDGVTPFLLRSTRGKGAFALVRTSNPSASEIQDLVVGGTPLYLRVAELVRQWGAGCVGGSGYSALGAVVGATNIAAMRALRQAMPHTLFLVPGFGAQGGSAEDVAAAFNSNGLGAVVNSSREVLFAYRHTGDCKAYASSARAAAQRSRGAINQVLSN